MRCQISKETKWIAAESWWVNTIAREPVLIPYTTGLRDLDNIYLDTTFATKKDPYRHFPTKAEGLQELLKKVAAYPDNTVFHFNAWTFGYEPVWTALATALRSQVLISCFPNKVSSIDMCRYMWTDINGGCIIRLRAVLASHLMKDRLFVASNVAIDTKGAA